MARRPARELLESLDRDALAKFQAGIRKRYSNEDIEFAADTETSVHPQTVIEHFGTWNAAKRAAGLVPRRFATRDELLRLLRELGERLGRTPTARDLDEHRGSMPSKSLYWHTFGSLTNALREAGFDVPVGEERLERAIDQGCTVALGLGRLPKFQEWGAARREDDSLLTEWQIYRMFDVRRGAWSTFQYLIAERLREDGYHVAPDGRVSQKRARAKRAPSGGAGRTRARQARARRGGAAR